MNKSADTCILFEDPGRKVTLCNYNYSHEGIYHPDRIMEEFDLLYLKEGEWEIWEDDNCYQMKADHILILEPGKHHYSLLRCTPEMRNVFLHFSAHSKDGMTSEGDFGSFLTLGKLTDCSMHPEIYRYIEKIIEIFWADDIPNRNYRTSALLSELLIDLSDLSRKNDAPNDGMVTNIVKRFRSNPEVFFSPEELAKEYGVSLRTMSGRFKKACGTSIHSYQMSLKLNMAYEALPENPERSLRDVAKSYGFYDEFQFSRLFKRQFGITPSARRKGMTVLP